MKSHLSLASTVSRNWLASQFPIHGRRLSRRRFSGIFICVAHASAHHSLGCAAHCAIDLARGPMPLLRLLWLTSVALSCGRAFTVGLHWFAMLARVSKVVCLPHDVMNNFLLVGWPSTFGQLAANLERLITTNRLHLLNRTD